MPFDGQITLTRLQKLERLRELLETATDAEQPRCGHCLMARMVADPIMKAAGFNPPIMPPLLAPHSDESSRRDIERQEIWKQQLSMAHDFLGARDPYVFASDTVRWKRAQIDAAIVRERMKGE